MAARVALAELKQAAELIPNQTMLINTIAPLEAKDSSEIENIVTTTDPLFQHGYPANTRHPAGQRPDLPTMRRLLRVKINDTIEP